MSLYNAVIHRATGAVRKWGATNFSDDCDHTTDSIVALMDGAVPPDDVPIYYCKIVSGEFVEMSVQEKSAVDDAKLSPFVASTELVDFLDENARVVDSITGIKGEFHVMQTLAHRRDLYNDAENPIYHSSVKPILGANGHLVEQANHILNLENIHSKLGWHCQQITKINYRRPKDLLIYYGWLSSFNSAENGWRNEKVAQDIARYSIVVLGDGIQDPVHDDYANTVVIISRVKALNPNILIFGYVVGNQALADFIVKVNQWEDLQVHGIFVDCAGYDYGVKRIVFNSLVDYIHERTHAKLCFVNAWNMDHIIGIENDSGYPNSIYNQDLAASHLSENDWYLLESYPINTLAYSDGYESKYDWAARGVKAIAHRSMFGINLAAVGIVANGYASGLALCKFMFVSALIFSLEAAGTSDNYYGAGSARVQFWTRPEIGAIKFWSLNPSVQVDLLDSDVYWRYVECGRAKIDFSAAAQDSVIENW